MVNKNQKVIVNQSLDYKTKIDKVYEKYLNLINGILNLSPTEILVAAKMFELLNYITFKTENYEIANELLLSQRYKDIVKKELNINTLGLNNYLANLKKKKIVLELEQGLKIINPKLFFKIYGDVEVVKVTFNFIIEEDIPESLSELEKPVKEKSNNIKTINQETNDIDTDSQISFGADIPSYSEEGELDEVRRNQELFKQGEL